MTSKMSKKWNRIAKQYGEELEQLQEQLFPVVNESSPMTYWDESLWDSIEMFGLVLDESSTYLESLKGFWVDQNTGLSRAEYWIPDGYLSQIPTIDYPPRDEAAWDAKPIN